MNYFSEQYEKIKYPISNTDRPGLRNAQLGAIHAIASHATLDRDSSAIIVMPTGSGKTGVLMLSPYILRKKKVLIVTPSVLVRSQIADDFQSLSTLKYLGVFQGDIPNPHVYEAKTSYSEDQKEKFESADVVVAAARISLTISENPIKDLFDYVIIDEAHHVPAKTWQDILLNMKSAHSLLVTATPFRLDKKAIKGDFVYTYPLSRAYKDGIFGDITYIPIDEAPNKDVLIALKAEEVFQHDRELGLNHYLMVRTETKTKAKILKEIYTQNTKLKLKRVDSTQNNKIVQKIIGELRSGLLDGLICVDMLGEGFDFPNLKIAAIHEPHKSLASTLQFVGRFARTNASDIGKASFIAMNDESLRIENQVLYSSDSIWQDMIISLSEGKINSESEHIDKINQFTLEENPEDFEISLHNIRLNAHAKIYKVDSFNLEGVLPEECMVDGAIYKDSSSMTVVAIAQNISVPLWSVGDQLIDIENTLYILHFQKCTSLLFIYSQNKSEKLYDLIAKSFAVNPEKIPRNEMNRVLGKLSNYEFFNTGMQNRYIESGESYRIYSGSNTASSIDKVTGKMRSAGHAFCKADGVEGSVTIGYSSGSKIWSSAYVSIPDYIRWCDFNGNKIVKSKLQNGFSGTP